MKHGCPRRQQSPNMAKSLSPKFWPNLAPPQGHVMSVKCEEPLYELTVQVWLLYDHPNFKYCTLFISGTELRTDRQTDGRTDDPNTRCPRRTFQAGGIKSESEKKSVMNNNKSFLAKVAAKFVYILINLKTINWQCHLTVARYTNYMCSLNFDQKILTSIPHISILQCNLCPYCSLLLQIQYKGTSYNQLHVNITDRWPSVHGMRIPFFVLAVQMLDGRSSWNPEIRIISHDIPIQFCQNLYFFLSNNYCRLIRVSWLTWASFVYKTLLITENVHYTWFPQIMTYLFQGRFKDFWGTFSRTFQGLFFVLSNIHSWKNDQQWTFQIRHTETIWSWVRQKNGEGGLGVCVYNFF